MENNNIEGLILDLKESLEREIHTQSRELREEMHQGFSEVPSSTSRMRVWNARVGLLQAGARSIARVSAWAETVDDRLLAQHAEIAELRERVTRLERKPEQ